MDSNEWIFKKLQFPKLNQHLVPGAYQNSVSSTNNFKSNDLKTDNTQLFKLGVEKNAEIPQANTGAKPELKPMQSMPLQIQKNPQTPLL